MPRIEEHTEDSGVESTAISREDSPNYTTGLEEQSSMSGGSEVARNAITSAGDDDEDIDETLSERLWGLTEMFPEVVRGGVGKLTYGTIGGSKWLYQFSRSAAWVFFTSSIILVAPALFEMERSQMEEMQRQQQRQILLGPGAAMSGGVGGMGAPPPPPAQH